VVSDPNETRDLLAAGSDEARRLAAAMRPALTAWAASADPLPTRFENSQRQETIERLRSLGYLR